jgi:ParB/RepB/Spo0J family partition protein
MTDTFTTLPLAAIAPSLTNPRKHFDPVKLSELTESIKASGVHQPILVRPLPGSRVQDTFDNGITGGGMRRPTHEIVAGERRYRACQQAGLADIPVLIRDMTDDQVLECQIVENLQRDDLTALEEAEGFEALQATGATVDGIASKIGKSRSYVFARLKLLDLSFECKQAMRAGHIDASRALLIARIPDTTLQTKALAEATRMDYRGEVCSLRAFASWLQANVMLKLDRAVFNISDSQLIPAAGNCTTCPKRTGANPDLFADVQSVDICTDPACFQAKTAGHRANIVATAEKRGMTLIDGDDAVDICDPDGDYLDGYSPLTQVREDTIDGQPRLLGALLGDDAPAPVLIENPWTRELIAAVPTDEAEAMLLARGLVKAAGVKAVKKDDIEGDIKRLQDKMQKEITKRFREDAFEALADVVHDCDDAVADKLVCGGLLRAWWLRRVEEMRATAIAKVFGLDLMKPEDSKTTGGVQDAQTTQVRLHVQRCDSASLYQALALFMVLDDCPGYFYSEPREPTLLNALAKEVGVDLDDMASDTRYTVQDEYAAELKQLKAQLKGTTGHNLPATGYRGPNGETWTGRGLMPRWLTVLVQSGQDKESFRITDQVKVITTPAKSPTTGTPAAQAKGSGGKKPKTSAAEAKAQIAAAMQAQEGTNPGADAQGIDGAGEQPVATSAADAPGVAQAGFVAAWPMGVAA